MVPKVQYKQLETLTYLCLETLKVMIVSNPRSNVVISRIQIAIFVVFRKKSRSGTSCGKFKVTKWLPAQLKRVALTLLRNTER